MYVFAPTFSADMTGATFAMHELKLPTKAHHLNGFSIKWPILFLSTAAILISEKLRYEGVTINAFLNTLPECMSIMKRMV